MRSFSAIKKSPFPTPAWGGGPGKWSERGKRKESVLAGHRTPSRHTHLAETRRLLAPFYRAKSAKKAYPTVSLSNRAPCECQGLRPRVTTPIRNYQKPIRNLHRLVSSDVEAEAEAVENATLSPLQLPFLMLM